MAQITATYILYKFPEETVTKVKHAEAGKEMRKAGAEEANTCEARRQQNGGSLLQNTGPDKDQHCHVSQVRLLVKLVLKPPGKSSR